MERATSRGDDFHGDVGDGGDDDGDRSDVDCARPCR